MNTNTFTTPSPDLKEHAKDLGRNVNQVAQDVKNQASDGFDQLKSEAKDRLQKAGGTASDALDSLRDFASERPFLTFGIGIALGVLLFSRRR